VTGPSAAARPGPTSILRRGRAASEQFFPSSRSARAGTILFNLNAIAQPRFAADSACHICNGRSADREWTPAYTPRAEHFRRLLPLAKSPCRFHDFDAVWRSLRDVRIAGFRLILSACLICGWNRLIAAGYGRMKGYRLVHEVPADLKKHLHRPASVNSMEDITPSHATSGYVG